jgi:hypothetical protein
MFRFHKKVLIRIDPKLRQFETTGLMLFKKNVQSQELTKQPFFVS